MLFTIISGLGLVTSAVMYYKGQKVDTKCHFVDYYQWQDRMTRRSYWVGIPSGIVFIASIIMQVL